ncbi:siderophore-interacting protein [Streptomyces sp. NPDC051907]|uniref:siderophore-interacting protein n=1 Tax=Streptomyces sp. NPDC051907 TaxID=3155284 RepID=UPI00343E2B9C
MPSPAPSTPSTPSDPRLPVRFVQVTGVARLTPHMARVSFGGPDLAGFALDGPAQQVKLYFPRPGQSAPRLPAPGDATEADVMRWYTAFQAIPEDERPWTRSYTVRAHRPEQTEIDVDFVLHDKGGPATRWAAAARPGDTLGMYGPSAYFAEPFALDAADWLLLAGDESALPAIGALLEALPEGARAVAYIEIPEAADEQRFGPSFGARNEATVHWLHRDAAGAGHGELLVEAVRAALLPAGAGAAWLGGEAGAVRELRRHLLDARGLERRAVHFCGHWRRALTQDDAPTPEDLAEARERLADAQARTA